MVPLGNVEPESPQYRFELSWEISDPLEYKRDPDVKFVGVDDVISVIYPGLLKDIVSVFPELFILIPAPPTREVNPCVGILGLFLI
jgi:hypothetical protein